MKQRLVTMVQMPALNTPQFDWVKSRLPDRPQPVPPIYQPEVAAEAIVWAAHHRHRELFVGLPTIASNQIAPGLLDRYLARTAYKSQETQEPDDRNPQDNLWRPAGGDHGAHARLYDRAHRRSPAPWAVTPRRILAVDTGAALDGATAASRAVRRNGRHP